MQAQGRPAYGCMAVRGRGTGGLTGRPPCVCLAWSAACPSFTRCAFVPWFLLLLLPFISASTLEEAGRRASE